MNYQTYTVNLLKHHLDVDKLIDDDIVKSLYELVTNNKVTIKYLTNTYPQEYIHELERLLSSSTKDIS
jgi:predicted transcriptional regulator with HTH domain